MMRTIAAMLLILALAGPSFGAAAELGPPGGPSDPWTIVAEKGTLALLCLVILWSYRRDFFREKEATAADLAAEKERLAKLQDVLVASTVALTNAAVSTARQTDATHALARSVNQLEDKVSHLLNP
jgi:hypothetical protein